MVLVARRAGREVEDGCYCERKEKGVDEGVCWSESYG